MFLFFLFQVVLKDDSYNQQNCHLWPCISEQHRNFFSPKESMKTKLTESTISPMDITAFLLVHTQEACRGEWKESVKARFLLYHTSAVCIDSTLQILGHSVLISSLYFDLKSHPTSLVPSTKGAEMLQVKQ